MTKEELLELQASIIISIRYSRLLEEISDTKDKNKKIEDSVFANFQAKTKESNDNFISSVKEQLRLIVENFEEDSYLICENGLLKEKMNLLRESDNFETIRYNIFVSSVLDRSISYANTDDYLEKLIVTLFEDDKDTLINEAFKAKPKEILKTTNEELKNIYESLSKTKVPLKLNLNKIDPKVINGMYKKASNISVPKVTKGAVKAAKTIAPKIGAFIQGHPYIVVGSIVVGGMIIVGATQYNKYHKNKTKECEFYNIKQDTLMFDLISLAWLITNASRYMSKEELQLYIMDIMKDIYELRNSFAVGLYPDINDIYEYSQNILLINSFESLIINSIY